MEDIQWAVANKDDQVSVDEMLDLIATARESGFEAMMGVVTNSATTLWQTDELADVVQALKLARQAFGNVRKVDISEDGVIVRIEVIDA